MNVEETIKHLGNHWELYKPAGILNSRFFNSYGKFTLSKV